MKSSIAALMVFALLGLFIQAAPAAVIVVDENLDDETLLFGNRLEQLIMQTAVSTGRTELEIVNYAIRNLRSQRENLRLGHDSVADESSPAANSRRHLLLGAFRTLGPLSGDEVCDILNNPNSLQITKGFC